MSKNNNKPISKGIAKVPVVMQLEALECGAASLTMVLAYYGKWIPLEQVRSDCGVSRDGSKAKNILKAARFYGLDAAGYRFEPDELRSKGTFPCIIHWNFNHFVVLKGFKGDKVYINDPANGEAVLTVQQFDEHFTGIVLMFEPGEEFKPEGHEKSMLSFAVKRLQGTKAAIIFAVIMSIIAALMGLINPVFSRIFLDSLLTGEAPEWIVPFFVLLFVISTVQIIVSAMQNIYSRRITGKMAAVGSSTFIWKILHMPIEFFTQRNAGDIQSRMKSNASIADTLINTFAPLALNVLMMVFYLVIMLRYSVVLTIVGISSLLINIFVTGFVSKKRVNTSRVLMRDEAQKNSFKVAGIEMIETIKASGAENGYFAKWSGYQAAVHTQNIKIQKLNSYWGMIPQFVSSTADSIVLILGVWLVMQGEFTAGMVMAFQGFLNSFMTPAKELISSGETLLQMRTQMERIDDVMEYPDDNIFATELSEEELDSIGCLKLSGKVELKNVTFGYAKLGPALINDFNLTLLPGQTVALVGSSGCGKSTVSNLVSGLYRPWSGEILFDGKPHSQIDKSVFAGSLAIVDQEIIMFEDTIANNITMWDSSIKDVDMVQAAEDAQIHEDIMKRPGAYQAKVIEGGKDFSGGQRQRIEIARSLAVNPSIIILDEATSALDARTEYEVVKAIQRRHITCIVVAHRLSTIRSCDEIILLDHGNIIDRGTHEQLMETSEYYRKLVTSD